MEHTQKLLKLTKQLITINEEARVQYTTRTHLDTYKVNFYEEVKPFADRALEILKEWEPLARAWVMENKPKYLYPIQIKNTFENIEMVSVVAWQKDTGPKKFNERVQSVEYVLEKIIEQVT
ncbi:YppE family protein [Guptibacillus hwajinpoensis]|uniref:YppE family protein n=1 Tax=Guptibacillus hwajinpoensis TaxID=208199 RepID=UPI001CFD4D28|nr:YppE family protein [Pseudalkalibacillus hwajinpoensis]WLR60237.1 YppE family protein [Pseudalkalibacillus hwajinpoensis]